MAWAQDFEAGRSSQVDENSKIAWAGTGSEIVT
jgi:hypothetical protein